MTPTTLIRDPAHPHDISAKANNLIQARDLPEYLRGNANPGDWLQIETKVVLTENGFTPEFEQGILDAENDPNSYITFANDEERKKFLATIDAMTDEEADAYIDAYPGGPSQLRHI